MATDGNTTKLRVEGFLCVFRVEIGVFEAAPRYGEGYVISMGVSKSETPEK